MNKKLLSFLFSIGTVSALHGVSVYDGFDYAVGLLANSNGGTGWSSTWGSFPLGNGISRGIGGTSGILVEAETLAAPADYSLPRSGNQLKGLLNYQSPFRELAVENRIDLNAPGTVYFSFLFSMDAITAGAGGSYLTLGFIGTDRTDLFRFGVGTGSTTANILSGASVPYAAGPSVTAGVSYLFVGKIDSAVGADTLSGQIYASTDLIGGEPGTWQMQTQQDVGPAMIDRIGVFFGGTDGAINHQGYFDELRFGNSFEGVTGVIPEPPTYAAFIGALGLCLVLWHRRRSKAGSDQPKF